MKALILGAGYGTRLGRLTQNTPKPMISIGGKPVLEHILFWLSKYGIEDVMVKVGYKKEVIMNYFGDRVLYFDSMVQEDEAIRQVARWFDHDYMLVQNGDTLTDLDLNDLFKMSEGKSIRFMDRDKITYAGTKILSPGYLVGTDNLVLDCAVDTWWGDMGTLEGLKELRKRYEQ